MNPITITGEKKFVSFINSFQSKQIQTPEQYNKIVKAAESLFNELSRLDPDSKEYRKKKDKFYKYNGLIYQYKYQMKKYSTNSEPNSTLSKRKRKDDHIGPNKKLKHDGNSEKSSNDSIDCIIIIEENYQKDIAYLNSEIEKKTNRINELEFSNFLIDENSHKYKGKYKDEKRMKEEQYEKLIDMVKKANGKLLSLEEQMGEKDEKLEKLNNKINGIKIILEN